MVIIRMARGGCKRRPFYRIVVTDSRSRRDGRSIECIGFFNPIAKGGETKVKIKDDRAKYWLDNGAQTSKQVTTLLKKNKQDSKIEKAA